jgi:TonB family protein
MRSLRSLRRKLCYQISAVVHSESQGGVCPGRPACPPTFANWRAGGTIGAESRCFSSAGTVPYSRFDSSAPAGLLHNNNVLMLDVQKGKPVSALGYIGELPNPSAQPVSAGSLASTSTKTNTTAAMPSSTAVVLRAVVDRDGSVEDVQRASGPVELRPAAIAAIRHWKFQPDPGGAMRRQIYITVNSTIYPVKESAPAAAMNETQPSHSCGWTISEHSTLSAFF